VMSASAVVPGPRSALDEGTLHDLCVDGAQVLLPRLVAQPAPPSSSGRSTLEVPDDARHLLDELPAYGT
ncbi:hypothetical protein, partial [Flexivirga sp.]|uniref:hypothetical protein n=1 Tax=Flexivirga sp. TaxID=1962927 RepID=UPI003F80EBBA